MATFIPYSQRNAILTPICLGYQLLPFSLGHSLALKSAGSKFTNGEYNTLCNVTNIMYRILADKTLIPEFVYAVMVCSTTYDDLKAECSTGEFQKEVSKVVKRIEDNNYDLMSEIHRFAHYLKNGTDAPIFKPMEESNGSIITNPVEAEEAIISTLMSECGYTRNECYTLPLTETMSAYLLYAHKMGSIELVSKEVFDLKQSLKEKGVM